MANLDERRVQALILALGSLEPYFPEIQGAISRARQTDSNCSEKAGDIYAKKIMHRVRAALLKAEG